jgi:hypothetical protein
VVLQVGDRTSRGLVPQESSKQKEMPTFGVYLETRRNCDSGLVRLFLFR